MDIKYTKNPLTTIISLTEHERQILWYKIKIEQMEDLLFHVHFYAEEERFNLDEIQSNSNPKYYMDSNDLNDRVDDLLKYYLEALSSVHCGDCTCVPCSCIKCHAEYLLGVDTISGLGKHAANSIRVAFLQHESIRDVLAELKNYEPPNEPYAKAWKQYSDDAYKWLLEYSKKFDLGD